MREPQGSAAHRPGDVVPSRPPEPRGTIAIVPKATTPKTISKSQKRKTAGEHIRLTGDRIVVEHPDDGERKTRGGLLIPATASPAPKRCVWGEVTLVGPDVRAIAPGDRILYLPQAGLEVELDGREQLLLRERDVQAVASPPADGDRRPGQYL